MVAMQDFRIDTFLSVCETLNYTKSAKLLHITQPAVSQHIHFLEDSYGVKLFSYRNRKLALTDQGRLLRDASLASRNDDEALRRKLAAGGGRAQRFALGLTMTVGEWMAADALAEFVKAHDDLQVSVRVSDTHALLAALDAGTLDCAVVEGFFDATAYDHRTLLWAPFVGVCAPGYLDCVRPWAFADLLGQRILTREPGSGTRGVLERALADRNLGIDNFAQVTETNSITLIKNLVARGCGVAFLYKAAVADELRAGMLARIPLDCDPLGHDITAVWRKGSFFGDWYAELIEEMGKSFAGELSD